MGLKNIISKIRGIKEEPKSISQIEREEFVKDAKSEMMLKNIVEYENRNFLYGN